MYSLLLGDLPDTVCVDGEKCFMRTDFKNWIKFELIITDTNLTGEQKLMATLPLCFRKLPSNPDVAIKACTEFYGGGSEGKKGGEHIRPLYSFLHDGDLIFSSFKSQYGIDLCSENMHWYKFRALLKGLGSDTKFAEVVYIRGLDLSGVKDDELRKKYRELKKIWKLPDTRSEKEKHDELVREIEKAL